MSSGTTGTYGSSPSEPNARPLPAGWIAEYEKRHVQIPYYPIRRLLFFDRTPITDSIIYSYKAW
jgi:hypothetical protein